MADQDFLSLARMALGDPDISESFLDALFPDTTRFSVLIQRWKTCGEPHTEQHLIEIWSEPASQTLLKDLALSLLFGVPFENGKAIDAQEPSPYFQGRFWNYVDAHPPGLSGGYFGHWSYPPEAR